jgi:septum formation topological specificity factor MinE
MNIEELNLSDEQMALVQKYVQSETDKVRTDYSAKLKTANDEIAKYKPIEKSDAEKALEERIAALETKEREIANKEKAMTIASKLKEKELPEGLAKYLNVGDDMDKSIEGLGAMFGNYFLTGSNKPSNHTTNKGITKDDFKKMSYSQRAKLYSENPQLYQALNK